MDLSFTLEIENTDGSGSEFDEGGEGGKSSEGSVTGVARADRASFILRSLKHTNHFYLMRKINANITFFNFMTICVSITY